MSYRDDCKGGAEDHFRRALGIPQSTSKRAREEPHPHHSPCADREPRITRRRPFRRHSPPVIPAINHSIPLTYPPPSETGPVLIRKKVKRARYDALCPSPSDPPPLPSDEPPPIPLSSTPRDSTEGEGIEEESGVRVTRSSAPVTPGTSAESWFRDVVGDKGDPKSRPSIPSVPFTFRSDRDPPRGPRAMPEPDDNHHVKCASVIDALRLELEEAKRKIEKLERPNDRPDATLIGPDGWALDPQILLSQYTDRQRELEKEKQTSDETIASLQKKLENKEAYISDLRTDLEKAQKSQSTPTAPGQLEIARSQLSKMLEKEIKWEVDKVLLQSTVSRQQTQITDLQSSLSRSTEQLEKRITNQKAQISGLLNAAKRRDAGPGSYQGRVQTDSSEDGWQSKNVREMVSQPPPTGGWKMKVETLESDLRRVKGLLEKSESDRESREREVESQIGRMTEESRLERDDLQSQMSEAKRLQERAEGGLREMTEARDMEKEKDLATKVDTLRLNEVDLQSALDSARTRYEKAEQEVERLREDLRIFKDGKLFQMDGRVKEWESQRERLVTKLDKAEEEIVRLQEIERGLRLENGLRTANKDQTDEQGNERDSERTRLQEEWKSEKTRLQSALKRIQGKLEEAQHEKATMRRNGESLERLTHDLRGQIKNLEGWDIVRPRHCFPRT